MQNNDQINEFYDLWVTIARVRDAIQCVRQNELRRYGLSAEQFSTLFAILLHSQGATIADISRSIFRQPHSVSEMVMRLEKQGLVKKVKNQSKKNLVCVTLTEKGYQAWLKAYEEESTLRIISSLTTAKRKRLHTYLNMLLNAALAEIGPRPRYLFRP